MDTSPETLLIEIARIARIDLLGREGHVTLPLQPSFRISSFHKFPVSNLIIKVEANTGFTFWVDFHDFIPASMQKKFQVESCSHYLGFKSASPTTLIGQEIDELLECLLCWHSFAVSAVPFGFIS